MLKKPNQTILRSLPILNCEKNEIRARYIIASKDATNGKIKLIIEALGYGVGQIASKNGLKIFECSKMVADEKRKDISKLVNHGTINGDWQYFDAAIEYDVIDFNTLGFSGLLSLLAGDVFGNPYVKDGLILYDIALPNAANSIFNGPRFGSDFIIKKCNTSNSRFILGLLLKPDLGVKPEHYADLAEAAVQGGIHYLKEDELTLDSDNCQRLLCIFRLKPATHSGRNLPVIPV